ncbi:hypothetical protein BH09PLA1_BH09PLA1_07930 [soil metagenome]
MREPLLYGALGALAVAGAAGLLLFMRTLGSEKA